MTKQIYSAVLVALAATQFSMSIAVAKQQCSASPAPNGYWSWRIIDERKCWYEGKPMLSKSQLEWPARALPQADSNEEREIIPTEKPANPLDAQARATDSETFEALWRARIDRH